jgi:aspartate/methionine/tyrosine aminotransferase
MGTTIFAEMSALAVATGSINLGQGFPDTDGPRSVAEAAARAVLDRGLAGRTERDLRGERPAPLRVG